MRRHPHDIYNKDRRQTIKQIAEGLARPPSKLVPGFDAELEHIIMKALAREPSDRYQTAAEFEAELRRFVQKRLKNNEKKD